MSINKTLTIFSICAFSLTSLFGKEPSPKNSTSPFSQKKTTSKNTSKTPTKSLNSNPFSTKNKQSQPTTKKRISSSTLNKTPQKAQKTHTSTAKNTQRPNTANKKTTKGITLANEKTMKGIRQVIGSLSSTQKRSLLKTLNQGTTTDLLKLPGVGEKTISHIKKARPFKDLSELGNVTGIGIKKFTKITKHFKTL